MAATVGNPRDLTPPSGCEASSNATKALVYLQRCSCVQPEHHLEVAGIESPAPFYAEGDAVSPWLTGDGTRLDRFAGRNEVTEGGRSKCIGFASQRDARPEASHVTAPIHFIHSDLFRRMS